MANNNSWTKIFKDNKILEHNFSKLPFYLSAKDIKKSVQDFKSTTEKEVRILCKMDTRESVPEIMKKNGLVLLPVKNGQYVIVRGEGYIDIPEIKRRSRDALRRKLKELGCYELQKSVFLWPYDCKKEIEFVIHFFNLKSFVIYAEASLDNDYKIKRAFHIV